MCIYHNIAYYRLHVISYHITYITKYNILQNRYIYIYICKHSPHRAVRIRQAPCAGTSSLGRIRKYAETTRSYISGIANKIMSANQS